MKSVVFALLVAGAAGFAPLAPSRIVSSSLRSDAAADVADVMVEEPVEVRILYSPLPFFSGAL